MALPPKKMDKDGKSLLFGDKILVERGLASSRDATPRWHIYRKTDVSDDTNTLLDFRWDEIASYVETEPGDIPDKATLRAIALAAKE